MEHRVDENSPAESILSQLNPNKIITHANSLRSILILYPYQRLGLTSGLLPWASSTDILMRLSHAYFTTSIAS